MRGYTSRRTHGCVGRTTKSTLRGKKAGTNIFRLNALYQEKTMSDYRRYRLTRNYRSLKEHKSVFVAFFFLQARVYPPLKELVVQKKLYYMNESPYLDVLHQCEWDCLPAHGPIDSAYNYLPSCLRTLNSRTSKFKWLYWQWEKGGGGTTKTQRRFSGCRRCNNTVNDDFKWDNYGMVIKQERAWKRGRGNGEF